MFKCEFGKKNVAYLEHLVSGKGVRADPTKLKAMEEWPRPSSLKALRGFLGLTEYYHRFIRGYGEIASPLIGLLKNSAFNWN